MERKGLRLGRTSVASLLLLGTGATQADLPPSELGDVAPPAIDEREQYVVECHEAQFASLAAELCDDSNSDDAEDAVLPRIGRLGPVLSYRSGRRAELEALLGSLPLLFELSVVPASSIIRRSTRELYDEAVRARRATSQLERLGGDQLGGDRLQDDTCAKGVTPQPCARYSEPSEDAGEVVLARDERFCLDACLAHLVRRITAEGPALGDHDRSVLSRLVVATLEDVLAREKLCTRLRVKLATGEVLAPPHLGTGRDDTERDRRAPRHSSLRANRRRARRLLPRRAPMARTCTVPDRMGQR